MAQTLKKNDKGAETGKQKDGNMMKHQTMMMKGEVGKESTMHHKCDMVLPHLILAQLKTIFYFHISVFTLLAYLTSN
jgi:hypothetical protein